MVMGVKDLRDGFNAVANPSGISCSQAFLGYDRAHDTEWQILTFRGTDSAGESFEVVSDPIPPGEDVIMAAAAATAQRLVEQSAQKAAKAAEVADAQAAEQEKAKAEIEAKAAEEPAPKPAPLALAETLKGLDQSTLSHLSAAVDRELQSRETAVVAAAAEAIASIQPDPPVEKAIDPVVEKPAAEQPAVEPAPATEGDPAP